jgi:hypothetical protein
LSRGVVKERTILNKGYITRYMYATRRWIITPITFMLKTIPQKNTLNRLCGQLSTLTRCKQNIACAPKNSKMIIARRRTKKYLTRTFVGQFGRWLSIDEIDCSRNSFTPKMRWDKG